MSTPESEDGTGEDVSRSFSPECDTNDPIKVEDVQKAAWRGAGRFIDTKYWRVWVSDGDTTLTWN